MGALLILLLTRDDDLTSCSSSLTMGLQDREKERTVLEMEFAP